MIEFSNYYIFSSCIITSIVAKQVITTLVIPYNKENYLKLTEACQTKANKIKNTGIIGNTSTIGANGAYASGSFASTSAKVVINILH
jgi:hypothetical protein